MHLEDMCGGRQRDTDHSHGNHNDVTTKVESGRITGNNRVRELVNTVSRKIPMLDELFIHIIRYRWRHKNKGQIAHGDNVTG